MEDLKKPIVMLKSYYETLKALVNSSIRQADDNSAALLDDGMLQVNHPSQRILKYNGNLKQTTVFYGLRFLVKEGIIFRVGTSRNILCVKFDPKVLSRWDIKIVKSMPKKLKSENKPEPKKEKGALVKEKEMQLVFLNKLEERVMAEKAEAVDMKIKIEKLIEEKAKLQSDLVDKEITITHLDKAIEALKGLNEIKIDL